MFEMELCIDEMVSPTRGLVEMTTPCDKERIKYIGVLGPLLCCHEAIRKIRNVIRRFKRAKPWDFGEGREPGVWVCELEERIPDVVMSGKVGDDVPLGVVLGSNYLSMWLYLYTAHLDRIGLHLSVLFDVDGINPPRREIEFIPSGVSHNRDVCKPLSDAVKFDLPTPYRKLSYVKRDVTFAVYPQFEREFMQDQAGLVVKTNFPEFYHMGWDVEYLKGVLSNQRFVVCPDLVMLTCQILKAHGVSPRDVTKLLK